MRTVTLEEHFVTASFITAAGSYSSTAHRRIREQMLDLDQGRIAAMDEAGIDLQVLSLAAMGFDSLEAVAATSLARDINDELAGAISRNPGRLGGFATLAMKQPAAAAAELDRCIGRLGFLGAMLDGTVDGRFLDDPIFLPVFEAAVALDVPIYLHPAPPPRTIKQAYFSGLPERAAEMLSISGWGWHAEAGLHTLRLILSGLFDRLPALQLIIGHMGEGLPYAMARSSAILSAAAPHLRQPIAAYFQTNIHITTSGYFTAPPLRCALEVIGIDRVLFSVDYPFASNTRGRALLDEAERLLDREQMEKLTHKNAERLLGV